MLIRFDDWKNRWEEFANIYNGKIKILKHASVGAEGNFYTIEISINVSSYRIIVFQGGGGTKYEVGISHIEFNYFNRDILNFNLSSFQKGFLERLFNSGSIKINNKLFAKQFGIYSTNKQIASKLFNNKRVQDLFLNNKFLLLNIQ